MSQDRVVDALIQGLLAIFAAGFFGVGLELAFTSDRGALAFVLCFVGIGLGVVGAAWMYIKEQVPERFVTTLGSFATDARVWMVGFFSLLLYGMVVSVVSPKMSPREESPPRHPPTLEDPTRKATEDFQVVQPSPAGRLLSKSIDDIINLCVGRSAIQAQDLTKDYIGNRVRIKEIIDRVYPYSSGKLEVNAGQSRHIFMILTFGPESRERLAAANPGTDMISTICRIELVTDNGAALEDCDVPEIIPAPTFTPTSGIPTPSAGETKRKRR